VLHANVAFRGVQVPAGKHLVRFTYTPPLWGAALATTAAAVVALAAWLGWALWTSRAHTRRAATR
jgi:hypothetical protein